MVFTDFFLFLLLLLRLLLFTHFGDIPVAEICFPQYFGNFREFFLLFMASVRSRSLNQPLVPGGLEEVVMPGGNSSITKLILILSKLATATTGGAWKPP